MSRESYKKRNKEEFIEDVRRLKKKYEKYLSKDDMLRILKSLL